MLSLVSDKKFMAMQKEHCKEIIALLMQKKVFFSIVCNVKCIGFEPALPQDIYDHFNPFELFILAGYTFESLQLDEKNLYFEAGFGKDNLGSFVTIPLESIVQILLPNGYENIQENSCIFINPSATFALPKDKGKDDEGIHGSMRALLSNPKNKKFKK